LPFSVNNHRENRFEAIAERSSGVRVQGEVLYCAVVNWLLRFSIGLTARPVDVTEMQRGVPELLDPKWPRQDHGVAWPHLLLPVVVLRQSGRVLDEPMELVNAIRAWAAKTPQVEVFDPLLHTVELGPCEHPDCPRRPNTKVRLPDDVDAPETRSAEMPLLQLMVVGGGPGQKPLRDRFLDLVRRVHAKAGEVKKVVVTDPYLLAEASDSGTHGGGFDNFCHYLRALQLAPDATLFIPPGLKSPTQNRALWIERIEKVFPGLRVNSFRSNLSFHDRFYIAEHAAGEVRGVFGPSMNGLSGTDIAIFGELEAPNSLETLSGWFDLKTPTRNNTKPKKRRPRR
jgi:hypothetical protein